MIWTLDLVDTQFVSAWLPAGEPDQRVIAAYVRKQPPRRQHQQERPGVKRWYYLLRDNQRTVLSTLGMPLEEWRDGAFFIVGTREIIGEFPGNQPYAGKKGLQLKMQPRAWMSGQADEPFASGRRLLDAISEQILDLDAAQRVQWAIKKNYRW